LEGKDVILDIGTVTEEEAATMVDNSKTTNIAFGISGGATFDSSRVEETAWASIKTDRNCKETNQEYNANYFASEIF